MYFRQKKKKNQQFKQGILFLYNYLLTTLLLSRAARLLIRATNYTFQSVNKATNTSLFMIVERNNSLKTETKKKIQAHIPD